MHFLTNLKIDEVEAKWQIFLFMGQTLKLQGAFMPMLDEAGSDLKCVLFSLVTPPHLPSTEKIGTILNTFVIFYIRPYIVYICHSTFYICTYIFYLHKQHTPNPEAHDPDAVPPLVKHSFDV